MKWRADIKDWQIAQAMFGRNKVPVVLSLKKHGVIEPLYDGWCVVRDSRLTDDCGWLVPSEFIEMDIASNVEAQNKINESMSWEEDEDRHGNNSNSYLSTKKLQRIAANPGAHIPNKNESRALRKIMSETGMCEQDVRSIKKYRKMLAEARTAQPKLSRLDRMSKRLMKSITKRMGLAKEHPDVLCEYKRLVNNGALSNHPYGKIQSQTLYTIRYKVNADRLEKSRADLDGE